MRRVNKLYFATIITVGLLLTATSCNDFLDLLPEGGVEAGATDYTKPDNIFRPVSAAYASLRSNNMHGFAFIGMLEVASDNADKGSSPEDNPPMKSVDDLTFDATNGLFNDYWMGNFNAVSSANFAISEMPRFIESLARDEDRLTAHQCEGEARFLRAYAYFNLVRAFGRVPIVDRVMSSSELSSLRQATTDETYAFILADLQQAVSVMPPSHSKSWAGRATKYTAMALKAKVHMYRQEWDSVASLTDKVIASHQYELLNNFREVFSVEGENSKESLFEVQSSTFGNSTGERTFTEYAYYQGPRGNTPSNMQGWGFCTPSTNLINFYTARGEVIRPATTLLYRKSLTPEGDSIKHNCANPVYNGKVYTPSFYNKWNYNGYGFDHNIRLLRYSDVLLMYAEALTRGASVALTSGLSAEQALNKVRTRAGLSDAPATIDNIIDERRAELAMEKDRYFDLIRLGKAKTALQAVGKNFVEGKHERYPIPANQRQTNLNLEQNNGYN